MTKPQILATDLDGTLIPLPDHAEHREDLEELTRQIHANGSQFIFVTGRHHESVLAAIKQFCLPRPDWLICDVGTTICEFSDGGETRIVSEYHQRLDQLAEGLQAYELAAIIGDHSELRLQEPEKQGPYKCSYYCDADRVDALAEELNGFCADRQIRYGVIHSVDPFNGDGLIDLLPDGVSKSHALQWWLDWQRVPRDAIVFAGDSGNDLAAMTEGYKTIVVGNATDRLKQQVQAHHEEQGWHGRVYVASESATSGVLEGWQYYSGEPDR